MTKPKSTFNDVVVKVEFAKGDFQVGRVQIPSDVSISAFFNHTNSFFVLKTDLGRSLLINKQYVVRIEPQENRSTASSDKVTS